MPRKLTVGSCFSGIGGLELGLEWTGGFETKWQIENDPYASRVLEKHWPNVKRYSDIRDVSFPEGVDVICGGFPCQDVSVVGTRAGLEGKRSTLWGEMFRLICEVKPRWVVAENVPGLLSSDDGRFFGNILRDLATIGFYAEWRVLSSRELGGAEHLRKRVFIIAYPSSVGRFEVEIFTTKYETGGYQPRSKGKPLQLVFTRGPWERLWCFPNSATVRTFDGFPFWMDEIRCYGNAVDPRVAQKIGEMILEFETKSREVLDALQTRRCTVNQSR